MKSPSSPAELGSLPPLPPRAPTRGGRLGQLFVRYFLRGLVVLVPVTVTIVVVYWMFSKVDNIFQPYVQSPGLGALLVLTLVFVVGWVSFFPTSRRVFGHVGEWLEQTPGISFIYTSTRDFLDAFAGKKRRFNHAVLVSIHAEDVWLVGFLTDEDLSGFKLGAKYVAVYTPQAYNVAGQLFLVKRERIRPIDHLSSAEVMKYAVTGGAVELATTLQPKPKAEPDPKAEPAAA